jgi:hypothetical protein
MGNPELVIAAIASVTFIWHVGMYAGIMLTRLKRLEDRSDIHEQRLDGHDSILERRSGSR